MHKANITKRCIDSIYEKSTYRNFEIILIDNNSCEEATFKMIEDYKNNKEPILKAIDEVARLNAVQLIAYNDFLDLEYIVIEGPVLLFKERFKESLLKYINMLDKVEFRARSGVNQVPFHARGIDIV